MKNHFFFSYTGNKRNEVKFIHDSINFDGITKIIEPFCGTSAFSFYISTLYPGKYKYVLNDNNSYLYEFYKLARNKEKLKEFIDDVNEILKTINKEKYVNMRQLSTHSQTLQEWFIYHKIYNIRPGLFPLKYKYKEINIEKCNIINFIRNEKIKFYNKNGVDILTKYKDKKKNLIFIDPPYLEAYNDFYSSPDVNIYEHLFYNPINHMTASVVLCLENTWIIQLLFSKCNKSLEYDKEYGLSKRKTKHIIILNK